MFSKMCIVEFKHIVFLMLFSKQIILISSDTIFNYLEVGFKLFYRWAFVLRRVWSFSTFCFKRKLNVRPRIFFYIGLDQTEMRLLSLLIVSCDSSISYFAMLEMMEMPNALKQ